MQGWAVEWSPGPWGATVWVLFFVACKQALSQPGWVYTVLLYSGEAYVGVWPGGQMERPGRQSIWGRGRTWLTGGLVTDATEPCSLTEVTMLY